MKEGEITSAAIMGGTFDPIHYGHLLAAERVREELCLQRIFFIPSGNPPHKSYEEMANAIERYDMVQLAIASNPYFEVMDIELKREGYSYTVDTISELSKLLGSKCKIYFIIGADNVLEIESWKNSAQLIKEVEFIVVPRPGKFEEQVKDKIIELRNKGVRIKVIEIPLVPIKSTDIRERVKSNRSIRHMVPEKVEAYIKQNNLYST